MFEYLFRIALKIHRAHSRDPGCNAQDYRYHSIWSWDLRPLSFLGVTTRTMWIPVHLGCRCPSHAHRTHAYWTEPEMYSVHREDTVESLMFQIEARNGILAFESKLRLNIKRSNDSRYHTIMKPYYPVRTYIDSAESDRHVMSWWIVIIWEQGPLPSSVDRRHARVAWLNNQSIMLRAYLFH
jgi:hypothetical protein